jgi:hypothetical protein
MISIRGWLGMDEAGNLGGMRGTGKIPEKSLSVTTDDFRSG